MEIVFICDSIKQRQQVFRMFQEVYQDELRHVNFRDYSFEYKGLFTKFVTPYNEEQYLRGRRDVTLAYPEHVLPLLKKLLKEKEKTK